MPTQTLPPGSPQEIVYTGPILALDDPEQRIVPIGASSIPFAIPVDRTILTWQTIYDVAPASIQLILQTSLDGVNFSDTDSSTSVSGEIRTLQTAAAFCRVYAVSATGGVGLRVMVSVKRSYET